MRYLGVQAHSVRLPIISPGDDLAGIVVDTVVKAVDEHNLKLNNSDIIGITEAIVAKSQGNFATVDDIAQDIRNKFPDGVVGLVFPILSRNRFFNILKGVARGAKKVYVLLKYPSDEVGNPIMDLDMLDNLNFNDAISAREFKAATNNYIHPFTGVDYISLYESAGDNIEVYLSNNPKDILNFTPNILVAEIHNRFRTKNQLSKAGAQVVYTLSDILSSPISNSGYNSDYGVLGSNVSTNESLKLFPRDCNEFIEKVRRGILERTGVLPEALVYGDGAFKDPACGIWELADPVVSPAYSQRLGGQPNEIKLKFVADNEFGGLSTEEKEAAIIKLISEKDKQENSYSDGTTPRKYADLLGSLCDLMSGSGDKGTPVILIQGYFDDYSIR